MLLDLADYLVKKSVWIVGGDGWAYDIGYGGLDHVLASGRNVNILVLDTEVYSNTGGQASKSTPMRRRSPSSPLAGKSMPKKDLGMIAMTYGNIYVAKVALGANDAQTVQGLPRGRGLHGPVADHRLQPLHRPRLRPGPRRRPAEAGGGLRPLAAVTASTRAACEKGEEPAAAGFRRAQDPHARSTCATRPATAWSSSRTPSTSRSSWPPSRSVDIANRYSVYEQLAKLSVTAKES